MEKFKDGEGGLNRIQLWRHSLACSVIARAIAKETGYPSTELPFVGGLLHDVGKIFYDEYFNKEYKEAIQIGQEQKIPWNNMEEKLLGYTHAQFSRKVIDHWKLPDQIRDVIVFHHHTYKQIFNYKSKDNKLIAIISVADKIAKMMGFCTGDLDTVEAVENQLAKFIQINDTEKLYEILKGTRKEINDLEMVLFLRN